MNAIQLIVAVMGNFTELAIFCMIGDLLEHKVRIFSDYFLNFDDFFFYFLQSTKIARVIQNSSFTEFDPTLQKNLILMIQISNRSKTISALGFFEFNWKSCSFVS